MARVPLSWRTPGRELEPARRARIKTPTLLRDGSNDHSVPFAVGIGVFRCAAMLIRSWWARVKRRRAKVQPRTRTAFGPSPDWLIQGCSTATVGRSKAGGQAGQRRPQDDPQASPMRPQTRSGQVARANLNGALGPGLLACQHGMSVRFTTAGSPVNELMKARDPRRLLRLQSQLASATSPSSMTRAPRSCPELLHESSSRSNERGATFITITQPFGNWPAFAPHLAGHCSAVDKPEPP